jgi:uncharacterized protein YcbK (DUF882 family)
MDRGGSRQIVKIQVKEGEEVEMKITCGLRENKSKDESSSLSDTLF